MSDRECPVCGFQYAVSRDWVNDEWGSVRSELRDDIPVCTLEYDWGVEIYLHGRPSTVYGDA